jgi:hypothetical protein
MGNAASSITPAAAPKATRGSKRGQGPASRKRPDHADHGRGRFARTHLMPAMLGITQGRKVGVIGRPIERVADRGDRAQHDQAHADAIDLRQQWILQAGCDRAGNQQRFHPEALGKDQHARADEEAAEQDRRD